MAGLGGSFAVCGKTSLWSVDYNMDKIIFFLPQWCNGNNPIPHALPLT